MYKATILSALSALFFTSAIAVPVEERTYSSPAVSVVFYTNTDCNASEPNSVFPNTVRAGQSCYFSPNAYSSVLITAIDDHFIGQNAALEVGYTAGDTCAFGEETVKFSVSNRDLVGKCQYIGIPQGGHLPDAAGNEWHLTTLQG